jgi:hypothetical protein
VGPDFGQITLEISAVCSVAKGFQSLEPFDIVFQLVDGKRKNSEDDARHFKPGHFGGGFCARCSEEGSFEIVCVISESETGS